MVCIYIYVRLGTPHVANCLYNGGYTTVLGFTGVERVAAPQSNYTSIPLTPTPSYYLLNSQVVGVKTLPRKVSIGIYYIGGRRQYIVASSKTIYYLFHKRTKLSSMYNLSYDLNSARTHQRLFCTIEPCFNENLTKEKGKRGWKEIAKFIPVVT